MVYSGIDLITSKTVALKVMSAKHKKESNLKAVKREIEYAMSVRCEYVVQLLDFVSDDQHVVIVWELIEGSDLLDLLNEKGGRLNERDAAFYFSQLHQAISFIHSNGLVHRDLKPENCMVEAATNKIKLIDFGLSKRDQSAVTLGVGTPDYMSPELLGMDAGDDFVALKQRREGKYDAKACDVWALGVLLYLLVTGKYAFEDPRKANNVIATLQNIRSGKMRALPSRISPECSDLIQKMLQHDPTKRITLVRTFLLLLTTARSSIQSRYRSAPAQALTRSFARSPVLPFTRPIWVRIPGSRCATWAATTRSSPPRPPCRRSPSRSCRRQRRASRRPRPSRSRRVPAARQRRRLDSPRPRGTSRETPSSR